ncbi:transcription factor SPT20 homolog [Sitophilus oryzae]|uniref:Transcription factor SPT20 homolog n=1 Tax=Sitophilus oryzae TaxID=7048 RepID=A0A6J2Y368_SITOR|nr:transcription factor SPT20 homolog [Sitophilus oryzae]
MHQQQQQQQQNQQMQQKNQQLLQQQNRQQQQILCPSSQVPSSGQQQPGANNPALSNIQKQQSSQQTAHSYQGNRSVENVAERLAPTQVQQDIPFNKPDVSTGRGSNYNSASLDVEQRLNLGRNISNLSNIVDRYSNEQRMMAGLQSSAGAYYSDKNLSTQHMFNKTMSSASQIFSQANMAGMTSYSQPMATSAASIYSRQMNELQAHQAQGEIKASSVPAAVPEKKSRKKKSSNKAAAASQDNQLSTTSQASSSTQAAQGFQSYAGLKAPASTGTSSASNLEPGAISLKTSSVVPEARSTSVREPPERWDSDPACTGESNFLDEFRSASPTSTWRPPRLITAPRRRIRRLGSERHRAATPPRRITRRS